MAGIKDPPPPVSAGRLGHEPNPLIIADGLDIDASLGGQDADLIELMSQRVDLLKNKRPCICSRYRWHAVVEMARREQTGMAQATLTEPASNATERAGDGRLQVRLIAAGGMLGALA